jgi:hypothetical protein
VNVRRHGTGSTSQPSPSSRKRRVRGGIVKHLGAIVGLSLAACRAPLPPFPPVEPLWRDPDRRPFAAELGPRYSPHDWDRLEKTFILPVRDVLTVSTPAESVNVNALDEVPDSSWFENRISRSPQPAELLAQGPCAGLVSDLSGPWRVVAAKPEGLTPGFVFETGGQRYLAKLDGSPGSARATVADVLGSRLYHAAGYRVPCNAIAHFDAAKLELDPLAKSENAFGERVPLTREQLLGVVARALRRSDGSYRAMVSRYLEGRSLGPWRYHGVMAGDRNDVVAHEDRRELRGSRLLAAWTGHVDQREGNTLAMWREAGAGRGYVLHHLLDFGDCFGSVWGATAQSAWRRGHDYWIDPPSILLDWITLGLVEHSWDRVSLGPLGLGLGFFDVASFDPESWRPSYPNPAFSRMTEHDAAWMARIVARIEPAHIQAMLAAADPPARFGAALLQILLGRRHKLLERYLSRLSPLADPVLRRDRGGTALCATDLSVQAGISAPAAYRASFATAPGAEQAPLEVRSVAGVEHCVRLPAAAAATIAAPRYVMLELAPAGPSRPGPIRFHLHALGPERWLLTGLERLED